MHVRVHGQFHQQAEETSREVHDEQRTRKLHRHTGRFICIIYFAIVHSQLKRGCLLSIDICY